MTSSVEEYVMHAASTAPLGLPWVAGRSVRADLRALPAQG